MNKALARLRARTDRELSILAEKQLEKTIRLAEIGKKEEAAQAYEAARRLLVVTNLSCTQRDQIEDQMTRVEAALHLDRPMSAVA